MPRVIFSVGYQELTPDKLEKLVTDLDCILVDCRTSPSGRVKKGFSRLALTERLGNRYVWKGNVLGGKGKGVQPEGLDWLRANSQRLMLMCMEEAPGDCHRHSKIALALVPDGIVVLHVHENEVIEATELQRAIDVDEKHFSDKPDDPGEPYTYVELDEVIASLKAAEKR